MESVFGVGKLRYGLDRIMARTKATSETMILLSVLVMNLETILRELLFVISEMWMCRCLQRLQSALGNLMPKPEPWFHGESSGNLALITA